MVYRIFKNRKNAFILSYNQCTWPSAKITNSMLLCPSWSSTQDIQINNQGSNRLVYQRVGLHVIPMAAALHLIQAIRQLAQPIGLPRGG